ncbi:MAG: flavin reductase [Bacteriovoracaceae bacterium]|nr:flavin reductase [Bacteriovoracaceae bacterium]
MVSINKRELEEMKDERYRGRLINCLSGIKTAVLIGTINHDNQTNLAVFSSLVHLGANPALMGLIVRPDISPRHTLENIIEQGEWSCNILSSHYKVAIHHTSARFSREQSEFSHCGLSEEFIEDVKSPFVKEAQIKWKMSLVRIVDIPENGTKLIIGSVSNIFIPDALLSEDGFIDVAKIDPCLVTGLDCYHQVNQGQRFTYAKPDHLPKPL